MRPLPTALALLLATPTLGACNMTRMGVNMTAPALKRASAAIDTEADVPFAREAAPGSLKTVEGFLLTAPDNPDLLEVAAQGNAQYAFGFLEGDLEALGEDAPDAQRQDLVNRATIHYDRAYQYALRLAALRDERIVDAMKGRTEDLQKLLDERYTRPEDGAALYWLGLSLGSGINLHKDDVDRIAQLPKATALLERAHTIAPDYFHHGAALALGVLYASAGPAMGGNPTKSKAMFDEVEKATQGRYLMSKVLFARYYAVVTQNRPLFEKTLRDVLATPASVWPEQRLANELAKRRAAIYLKQADDLF